MKEGNRGIRDKSRVRCFNCQAYGHFAVECRKPRKEREAQREINLSQITKDEPALLIAKVREIEVNSMLSKEDSIVQNQCVDTKEQKES